MWQRANNKKNKGFTLIELVIVVAILAILVGLLAPQYTKYVEKARKAADVSNLEELVKAVKVASADADYDISGANTVYKIVLTDLGTILLADAPPFPPEGSFRISVLDAIEDYTGYTLSQRDLAPCRQLTTKSMKWGTTGAVSFSGASSMIYAKITFNGGGNISDITYSPNVENYRNSETA